MSMGVKSPDARGSGRYSGRRGGDLEADLDVAEDDGFNPTSESSAIPEHPSTILSHEWDTWQPWRQRVAFILEHRNFDTTIGVIITLNVITMIIETNANAECQPCEKSSVDALDVINWIFLSFYTLEVAARIYVHRFKFWTSFWNLLDFFVVLMGYIDVVSFVFSDSAALPDAKTLKIFRMLRMARVLRFIGLFPALQGIVRGFACAMMAMFWGVATIFALLLMYSIFAVELVYPYTREFDFVNPWCSEAFSSVQLALIYFFQTVMVGDSWGDCVIPIAKDHWYIFLFFGAALVSVQLGLMNLILTAIVDEANYAHECDTEARCREMKSQQEKQVQQLGPMFRSIDTDGSGSLSLEELLAAFDSDMRLQKTLKLLHIDRTGLCDLFHLMDADSSGSINYEEFVGAMQTAQMQDLRVQMMKIKLQNSFTAFAVQSLAKDLSNRGLSAPAISRNMVPATLAERGPATPPEASWSTSNDKTLDRLDNSPLVDRTAQVASLSAGSVLAAIESELACFRQGLQGSIAVLLEQTTKGEFAAASPKEGDILDNIVMEIDSSCKPPAGVGERGLDANVVDPRPQASMRIKHTKHPVQNRGDDGSAWAEGTIPC